MKRTLLLTIILLLGLALNARPALAQDTSLTGNAELVMRWIELSVVPAAEAAAKDVFAPDFVFYGANDNIILDADHFIRMDEGRGFLRAALDCAVKAEHDLVEASYTLLTYNELREVPRTVLFRIENGLIAEAWLSHTL